MITIITLTFIKITTDDDLILIHFKIFLKIHNYLFLLFIKQLLFITRGMFDFENNGKNYKKVNFYFINFLLFEIYADKTLKTNEHAIQIMLNKYIIKYKNMLLHPIQQT